MDSRVWGEPTTFSFSSSSSVSSGHSQWSDSDVFSPVWTVTSLSSTSSSSFDTASFVVFATTATVTSTDDDDKEEEEEKDEEEDVIRLFRFSFSFVVFCGCAWESSPAGRGSNPSFFLIVDPEVQLLWEWECGLAMVVVW